MGRACGAGGSRQPRHVWLASTRLARSLCGAVDHGCDRFAIFYSIYVIFREFASVPYNALGTELTQDDADRKSLYS